MFVAFACCDHNHGDEVSGDLSEGLHKEDGGQHARAVFRGSKSAAVNHTHPEPKGIHTQK